jgi:adenosylcobinamide kinase/adenosylcobinamide-phosphate guanylyltransferase
MSQSIPPRLTLVLGGARSGKSQHGEKLIQATPPPWHYFATAEAGDAEMRARILLHRQRRDSRWITCDVGLDLASALRKLRAGEGSVLVDCLTLWLSNVMLDGREMDVETNSLVAALGSADVPIVAISNEVGLGIVPDNALARQFRDAQGRLNQQIAAIADEVIFVAAGLPLTLKTSHARDRSQT